jgi:hypothetical protein
MVTVRLTGSMPRTNRGRWSPAVTPSPRRWPTVKPYAPAWVPTVAPVAASTTGPGCSPSRRVRKPRVSPSEMKQMSWLSGLVATA